MVTIRPDRGKRCVTPKDSEVQPGTASSPETLHPEDVSKRLVGIFKLLADETRLRILLLLSERQELHVRALCELLDQSQPAVSHHLALLRTDGLIECRRDGKHNYYHILPQRFEQLIGTVSSVLPSSVAGNGAESPQDTSTTQTDKTDG